eukprot:CAMPEP_0185588012 /NCGR_PEP_ID=MMETSP0434-20130131/51514_1 /TAXON_ID=626734 ORGANISM="Favella taraikaensis, Strain Fe Narragansett Bay" /NCGR_SAMPLE_ID=MMETSP0434 /ASSEMBLY_ACC=CAM_ASM_000379 /LENGTH=53 /DNA_ID=CAMNT_0028210359 /DNA_START=1047 /DNA_END=1208 /DNA_ORIENTATION=-
MRRSEDQDQDQDQEQNGRRDSHRFNRVLDQVLRVKSVEEMQEEEERELGEAPV